MRRVAGAAVALIGGFALLGWWLDRPALRNGFSRGLDVGPVTALVFLLAGLALALPDSLAATRGGRLLARAPGSVMLLILVAVVLLPDPGALERALAPVGLAEVASAPKVALTRAGAVLLGLFGILLALRDRAGRAWVLSARTLGAFVGMLATLVVLAYLGARAALPGPGSVPQSLNGGLGFLGLAVGMLMAAGDVDRHGTLEPTARVLRSRVRFALTVATAILVGTSVLALWGVGGSRAAAAERARAEVWRESLDRVRSAVLGAEAAQHRLLITGDTAMGPPFRAASAAVSERLGELLRLADSTPPRSPLLDSLRTAVTTTLTILESQARQRLAGQPDSAIAGVRAGVGGGLIDEVRRGVGRLDAVQDSIVHAWDRRLASRERTASTAGLVAGVLAVAFLWMAGAAINRDILKRARAEAERDRFFDLSLDMLCIARSDGYFKRVSPAFTRTLGWSQDELLATPFMELVHPDDREATRREVERQVQGGEEVLSFDNRYRHRDGSWRILSWRSIPQPGGLMYATARDVTEQRRADEALRRAKAAAESANEAKSGFLAKMSHELRTPLNSILGFSELLQDQAVGTLNEKQRRYVGNVLTSGRSLLELINDILDLSKVEAGRMELAPAALDAREVLEAVRSTTAPLADRKQLTLSVAVDDTLPPLWADRTRFIQVMYNLIGNAIKFTPEGGRIVVTARPIAPEDGPMGAGGIEVAVSDTGIGIAPEDQERIFREFEQVASVARGGESGTGLGLPLTRRLVELHGGAVTVESAVGKGSTFRCRFPGAPRPGLWPPPPGPSLRELVPAGPAGAPLILIVDDEQQARDLLAETLLDAGYRVAAVPTGEEALRAAEALRPDAMTLDILMPGRDGLVTLAQLKNFPATMDIPVVVVSVSDQRELGFSLGAVDWLVKPVRRSALEAALARLLGPRPTRPTQRVLVVDDDQPTREYLHDLLLRNGYEVDLASGGINGVARATESVPDLVVLDLMMPDMHGFEVVQALRTHQATREVPILVLTARSLSEEERHELSASVQGILSKGGKDQLLEELDRILLLSGRAAT